MSFVVIGQSSGATMDQIMAVYPRHKIVVDSFIERGAVIGIGPFSDGGNMAFFAPETTPNNSFAPIRSSSKVSSRHSASTSGALTSADERHQAMSKRSAFITLVHAETKSSTNFSSASADP